MKFFNGFFEIIIKINDFFKEEKKFGFNGFFILFLITLIIVGVGIELKNSFGNVLFLCSIFLFSCLIIIGLTFSFSTKAFKKYIFWGEQNNLVGFFREFSFYSYILCLIFISIILFIMFLGLSASANLVNITFIFEWTKDNKNIILFTIIFIESIFWFAYHIVYKTSTIEEIKIMVTLLSAIAASLLIYVENFKLIITYIACSYFWINYLIELSVKNSKTVYKEDLYEYGETELCSKTRRN